MGLKSTLANNADASVLFEPAAPDNITLSTQADTSYFVLGDPAEIVLPPISNCVGRRLTLNLITPNNRITAHDAQTPIIWAGQTVNEIIPANPGTYEFRAIGGSTQFWIVLASEGSRARRNMDVAYVSIGELPAPYEAQPAGSAGRFTINGATGSVQPQADGSTPYAVGQVVLFPFATVGSGVYLVRRNNSAEDWQLEILPNDLDSNSGTEYHVLRGDVFSGRVVTQYSESTFTLDRNGLTYWPLANNPLNGSSDPIFDSARFNNELIFGKINRVTTINSSGTMNFGLVCPSGNITDQRFAIKLVDNSVPSTITISVPQSIESLDHTVGSVATFPSSDGLYAEWSLDPSGVWRLVSVVP